MAKEGDGMNNKDFLEQQWLLNDGARAIGQKQYKKLIKGGKLTYKEAIYAKCYECCSGYVNGKVDCKVSSCPLYQHMPFRGKGID